MARDAADTSPYWAARGGGELAAAQGELPVTRIVLVTRNGECVPAGIEDDVREIAAAAGIPVYRSMEAAAVAIAAGGRHGTA
ncbi:hypothetical protein [Nonomuraea sp. NPDC048916]|uniref:hypothetical protein n=1 Tax=Nonomuraea sp. NPDC048916 TaxID=3154232 RepID=UPI003404A3B1